MSDGIREGAGSCAHIYSRKHVNRASVIVKLQIASGGRTLENHTRELG